MKHVLDGDVHWLNLANTIEPSVCDVLSNFFDHLFSICDFLALTIYL